MCCGPRGLWVYFLWVFIAEHTAFWSRFYEVDWECEHPPLPANQSGIKVLVAGFAKTGTRTMSRSLWQVGLDHSYHSEEFGLFVWANLADKFWLKRSGGRWSQLPFPGSLLNVNYNDWRVLNGTTSEELAAAASRCRVDALAFDGLEKLMIPYYKVSPGAKVILMNWRTFKQWRTSLETFGPQLLLEIGVMSMIGSSLQAFPWSALLKVVDKLVGSEIETMMKTGGPPICQVMTPMMMWWHTTTALRRIASRWFSGIQLYPENEEEYDTYFQEVKDLVPKEDLFEWDMRKHTFEDLCDFIGLKPCPKSGKMPRARNNFIFQRDFPMITVTCLPWLFVLHYVNWKILKFLFSRGARFLGLKQPKADKAD